MIITVQRTRKTADGLFGELVAEHFKCYTVENLRLSIPAGTYKLNFTYSPKFGHVMPHIVVPERDRLTPDDDAGLRIHPANYPHQLQGCIAVGNRLESNAVSNSRMTFTELLKVIGGQDSLQIQILDIVDEALQ